MKTRIVLFLLVAALGAPGLAAEIPQAIVLSPNGGESLLRGSEAVITWSCSHCPPGANLVVEVFNTLHAGPGYSGQVSPAGVPMSQGFFKWSAVGKLADGSWLVPGPGYKIHLEAIDGSDASDATFSIVELKIPKIAIPRLAVRRLSLCPECVRIDLRGLREEFKGIPVAYRVALYGNGRQVTELGLFGGGQRGGDFLETKLAQAPPAQGRRIRPRFELRLFDLQGRLLQSREIRLDWL